MAQAPRAAEPKKNKDKKLAAADGPIIESYASLMPTGDIKRRKEIWKARDGDAELSFAGEVELTAVFEAMEIPRSQLSYDADYSWHHSH